MKQEPKILHLLPGLNLHGGTPRKTLSLIQGSRFKHGVYTWARWESATVYDSCLKIFDDNGVFVKTGPQSRNLFLHAAQIARLVRRHGFTVIHGYFDGGIYLAMLTKLLLNKTRSVISFVGVEKPRTRLLRFTLNQALRKIDRVIFVSKYVQQERTSQSPRLSGIPSKIIHNGTDRRLVSGKPVIKPAINYFVSVGGLNEHKNHETLIETASILKKRGVRDYCIDILGEGPLRDKFEALSKKLKVENTIRFQGYTENVGDYLNAADAYLHPASNEGFGIAVIEAMQMGLPVVLANAGALPELAIPNKSALYAPVDDPELWGNALELLMKSEELRRNLGKAAQKRAASHYSLQQFITNHDYLYESLFENIYDQSIA